MQQPQAFIHFQHLPTMSVTHTAGYAMPPTRSTSVPMPHTALAVDQSCAMATPVSRLAVHGTAGRGGASSSIATLLASCGPQTQKATLRALALAARSEGPDLWEHYFGRVLILVLESVTLRSVPGIKEVALLCLQELIAHQPRFFQDYAEVVISKLFETHRCCTQAERPIMAMVERTLERLTGALSPQRALETLTPMLASECPVVLQLTMRLLSVSWRRMQPEEVLSQLATVLPAVVAAFSHPNPDVRKAAVFCLVDVYMRLGEEAIPHLVKDLTPSQMKLVTIYINRQQKDREDMAHVSAVGGFQSNLEL